MASVGQINSLLDLFGLQIGHNMPISLVNAIVTLLVIRWNIHYNLIS